MNKVSVIVPVYNVENYLEKCLDSLVNQTLKDIEIIIINDGSPDNSQKIIDKYAKKYKNIVSINDTNHGQGHARNEGIKIASSKYIMFVDSDDWLELDAIEKMYQIIEKENSDVVVADINKIINNQTQYFKNYHNYSEQDNINLMLSHPGPVAKLYKKDIFLKNDIHFLENVYYEDLAMAPILSLYVKKIRYINQPVYNYLIRENSTMKQKTYNKKIDDIFIVVNHIEEEFKKRFKGQYQKELEYINIEHLLYSAALRYLDFPIYKEKISKIIEIIKNKYPNWKENIYYKQKSKKFKLICNLVYNNNLLILKLIKKLTNK